MTWHSPVASADRTRWQRETAEALVRLLVSAAEAQAEPLRWTVSEGLVLIGQVPARHGSKARQEVIEIFSVWLDLLDCGSPRRHESADGSLTLKAECRWERVPVMLSAYIVDSDDQGEDR